MFAPPRLKVGDLCFPVLALVIFCSSIISSDLWAEKSTRIFERITIEQGLSQTTIYCILQDRRGFLWIGTEDGLNRYDGINFKVYKHDFENARSISHNAVMALYEDLSGVLWIGTYGGGLNKYIQTRDTFVRYQNDPDDGDSLANNFVHSIFEDSTGRLWIGTEQGLDEFKRAQNKFIHFQHDAENPDSLNHNLIQVISEDKAGTLWIGTVGGGLNKFDRDSGICVHFRNDPAEPDSLSHDDVWSLYHDEAGALWVGTGKGLNKFDSGKGIFEHYQSDPDEPGSLSNNSVYSILEDDTGVLWIGTYGGGLNKFNPENNTFTTYYHEPENESSLSHNQVWSIFEDRSGLLWIGTAGGLNKYDRKKGRFLTYRHDPGSPQSLSDSEVWSLHQDATGTLWIGTGDGLNSFNPRTETFVCYKNRPDDPKSLSKNLVLSIYEDRTGVLWIGTYLGGLNKLNRQTGKFKHYRHNPNEVQSLSHDTVWTIFEDSSDRLWLGTKKGLNKFDRERDIFEHYFAQPDDPNSLSHNAISVIYEDHEGVLWIGTEGGGLNKFVPKTETFVQFLHDPGNPESLSHNEILSIHEDEQRVLWVGTYGGGLNKFDRISETFSHYREKDGLPNDVIYGMLGDEAGNFWLSTNKGLSKFNPSKGTFKNFNLQDGLPSNEFNAGAYFKNNSGHMFFGSINGFISFDPASIKDNPHIPPIALIDFQLFNESVPVNAGSVLHKSITETKEITLSYDDNFFSFEFVALDFSIPEKNHYACQMEGFDKNWNYIKTRRYITYTNLDAGEYVFRVKGSNNDGLWNEEGTALKLTIAPPPWKTWWAYSLYVLLGLGIIAGYVHYNNKAQARALEQHRLELEQERLLTERLRQIDKLKDDFLANISHELRTPLNGIIGITESLFDGVAGQLGPQVKENLTMVIFSGKRLAGLVNEILDFTKLKNQTLELQRKPLDLRTLTDVILKLSKPLLVNKKVALRNNIPVDIPPVYGDENRLQQIMHNLVGNAVKFTDSGTVSVSARVDENHVAVSISDTGIGIPTDKIDSIFQSFIQVDTSIAREYGGAGLGLAITKQLVELHHGTISVASEPGQGSIFTFTLPISKEKIQIMKPVEAVSKVRAEEKAAVIKFSPQQDLKSGQYQILIVDDEPVNQKVLSNHLAFENYAISQVLTGQEALQIIESGQKFDMILLDIMMPKMSGYEVCQKIRQKYLPSELPIIMITAKNQVSDLVEGFSSGANDYLAKPFSKNELLARIRTQLNLMNINAASWKFVPHEFLRTLGRETILDVKLGDQVQNEMTILFSDIRDYTSLSETMTPKENFDFINSYLSKIGPIIRDHDGFVNQYYGDGIMALFYGRTAAAVRAAIKMQKQGQKYNSYRVSKGRLPITVGIGLHTGTLMLGVIGDRSRMDGSVVSDAVNSASRLEGLTKIYGVSIIISDSIFTKIKNKEQFFYRSLGRVQAKGKKKVLNVYEICDGDPDHILELKKKTKCDFDQGLNYYFERDFDNAALYFDKVLAVHEQDTATKLFLYRSTQLMIHGVPDNWQGIETMDIK
ncbi:two-component regulator propeller domain-containing protein [candidate division CSSED10-310 bacterium]|uniref:histidine kinase n=1 Tax=candidate division CSSED10-310 bacterium TaxID=2855610 RepID=A0ABV6Z0V4_UNCC1